MAVILVATDDLATASVLSGTIESMGHTPLAVASTENIIEDILLNEVVMVLVAEGLEPFSGWDVCEIIRNDPTVSREFPVLMLVHGKGNVRRLEKCGFTGTISPGLSAADLSEEIHRHLRENLVPDPFDPLAELELEASPKTRRSRASTSTTRKKRR